MHNALPLVFISEFPFLPDKLEFDGYKVNESTSSWLLIFNPITL